MITSDHRIQQPTAVVSLVFEQLNPVWGTNTIKIAIYNLHRASDAHHAFINDYTKHMINTVRTHNGIYFQLSRTQTIEFLKAMHKDLNIWYTANAGFTAEFLWFHDIVENARLQNDSFAVHMKQVNRAFFDSFSTAHQR